MQGEERDATTGAGFDLFGAPLQAAGEAPRRYATVAPEVPVAGAFSYRVPVELTERCLPGVRVRVPFGGRSVRGFVLDVGGACPVAATRVRAIAAVLDEEPVVTEGVLALARWAADYYRAALGEVLAAAIPADVSRKERTRPARRRVELVAAPAGGVAGEPAGREERLGAAQRRVLDALASGPLLLDALRERVSAPADLLRKLEARGLLRVTDEAPPARPTYALVAGPELTTEQALVSGPLLRQVAQGEPVTTLLFGVTGSGKTEVYLRAINEALARGRGAIVLVPEIALTPQTMERFRARFGDRVAVLHSQLGPEARRAEWRRIRRGEAPVVVGPRSAVWAPVPDLGLVVVDEEHETTYKQDGAPRYHARDLAVVRGRLAGVPVLLGSATPSLESWHNATTGRYRLARLRSRPAGASLPRVQIIDMGREWAEVKGAPVLSRVLVREMQHALGRGEQVLLFQNRRGFTTWLECPYCRHVLKCRQCDVTLTYHRSAEATVCHFCDLRAPPPTGPCPACLGPALRQKGWGTERIEDIVRQLFPGVGVGRLDTDIVREGDPAEAVLERFRKGEVRVLVGTQMIAKGLDVSAVTVVGVISADTGLALPDFRASERTFQLVSQVAGRAGRGARPGVTVVQTFLPGHFAILAAANHDFEAFAKVELEQRRALGYPPYARALKLLVRGPDEAKVQAEAARVVEALRAAVGPEQGVAAVLGPAPSPRAFLTGKFRWQALVKATREGVRAALAQLDAAPPKGVEWTVDVDPYHLL